MNDITLLIVALIVFGGVWGYMWSVDAKVAKLQREIEEDRADTASA